MQIYGTWFVCATSFFDSIIFANSSVRLPNLGVQEQGDLYLQYCKMLLVVTKCTPNVVYGSGRIREDF